MITYISDIYKTSTYLHMGKILYISFKSENIKSNSKKIKLVVPKNASDGTIHSESTIVLGSYTISKDITKTLNAIEFNAGKQEYIEVKDDNIKITGTTLSLCMWLYVKTESGVRNGIFEHFRDDGKGKTSNRIGIKTGDTADKLVMFINNSSATINITNDKWFHLCWTLEKTDNNGLADWKIYINGKKDGVITFSKSVYLNTDIKNNRILLGKASGNTLNYFNGNLAEISLYDKIIDPLLEIYSDDPTIKYLMNPNFKTEGFETGGGIYNYDYKLNEYDSVSNDKSSNITTYGAGDAVDNALDVSNMIIGRKDENMFLQMDDLSKYPIVAPIENYNTEYSTESITSLSENTNYENLGLGIFFIIFSVVIYKYF